MEDYDIKIEYYVDYLVLYRNIKFHKDSFNIDTIFKNHKFNCPLSYFIKNKNDETIIKAYYFKPIINVYNEPFSEEDYKILLTKLKNHFIENECKYNIICWTAKKCYLS